MNLKLILFFFITSLSVASFSHADCLPQYENQVAKKSFFNSKKEYQLMLAALKEAQDQEKHARLESPILSLLTKKIAKKIKEMVLTEDMVGNLLLRMNEFNILCKGEAEKPVKFDDLVKNFQQLRIDLEKKERPFYLNKLNELSEDIISPQETINLFRKIDYHFPLEELIPFYRSKIPPTINEIKQFTEASNLSTEEKLNFNLAAFDFNLIKTPQDFLDLFKVKVKENSPFINNKIFDQVFDLSEKPNHEQMAEMAKLSHTPHELWNRYFWHYSIKTPQDFVDSFTQNPQVLITADSLTNFFTLHPTPTIDQINFLIQKFPKSSRQNLVRDMAIKGKIVTTPQGLIDLYNKGDEDRLERESTPTIEELIQSFIDASSESPLHPTLEQMKRIAQISVHGDSFWNNYAWKNIIKTPQDFIDTFSANTDVKMTTPSIEKFLSMDPSPSMKQMLQMFDLYSKNKKGRGEKSDNDLRNMVYYKDLVKTPQDLVDLFSGIGKVNLLDSTLEKFFTMLPTPTIAQVVALASIHAPNKNDHQALRNMAYNKNLVQTPQDLIDLFDGIGKVNLLDSTVEKFFSMDTAPTIAQVVALEKIHQGNCNHSIRNKAYHAKLAKTPQDIIDLFSGIGPVDLLKTTLEKFFTMELNPTFDQVKAFVKIYKRPQEVLTMAEARNYVQTPQDLIDLISGIGSGLNLQSSTIEKFFTLEPAPTLAQVLALSHIHQGHKQEIRNMAYNKNYVQRPQDLIDLFSGMGRVDFLDTTIEKFFSLNPSVQETKELIKISGARNLEHIRKLSHEQQLRIRNPLIIKNMKEEVLVELRKKAEKIGDEDFCNPKNPPNVGDAQKEKFFQLWGDMNSALLKKYQQLNSLKKRGEPSTCQVCLEKRSGPFFSCDQSANCHFEECAECLRDDLQLKMKEKRYPLGCENCHHEIPLMEEDFKLLGMEASFAEVVKESVQAYHRILLPKAKDCGAAGCINRITNFELDKNHHYQCQFCESRFCIKCSEQHPEISCEKYQESKVADKAFQKLVRDPKSGVRPCPYCFRPFNKDEQCSTITCTNRDCRKQWDWVEGRVQSSRHRFGEDKIPRKYRVPGDINEKTGKPYTDYTYLGKDPDNQVK